MLRIVYFLLVVLMCVGLALLALWPLAIKPHLHAWISDQLQVEGKKHGLLLRTDEFNITGFSEIELVSAHIDEANRQWSLQAPLVTIDVSVLSLLLGTQPIKRIHLFEPVFVGSVASKSSSKMAFEIPSGLKEITIDNGFIQIEDPDHKLSLRVTHLNGRVQKRFSTFTLKASSSDTWAEYQGQSVDLNALSVAASLRESGSMRHIDVRSLLATRSDSSVAAHGMLEIDEAFKLHRIENAGFRADVNLKETLQPLVADTRIGGRLLAYGDVTLKHPNSNPSVEGRFGLRDLAIDDINISVTEGAFAATSKVISLSEVEALLGGTLVRLDAQIEPERGFRTGVTANFKKLSLHDLLIDLGITPVFVDMELEANLQAEGSVWPNFHLSGTMNGQGNDFFVANRSAKLARSNDVILETRAPIVLRSLIDIDSRAFRFKQANISDGISTVTTDCDLYFTQTEGLLAHVLSDHFDFRSINEKLGEQSYRGIGLVRAKVAGSYNDIRVDADASLHSFFFEDYDLGKVKSALHYEGDDLIFKDTLVEATHGSLQGGMTITFGDDVFMDLSVDTLMASLPQALRLGDELGVTVRGEATGSLKVKGPLGKSQLNKLSGAGNIMFRNGVRVGDVFFDNVGLKAHATNEEWIIDSLVASLTHGNAYVSGSIFKETLAATLTVKGQDLSLADFSGIEGTLNAAGTLGGTLTNPILKGSVDLIGVENAFFSLGDQHLTFEPNENDGLAMSGTLLSGRAKLDGKATIDWKQGSLNAPYVRVTSKEGDEIVMSGTLNRDASDLLLTATINLDTLQLSSDEFETVQGLVRGQVRLKGDVFDPSWSGALSVAGGTIKHASLNNAVEDIFADLTLSQKELTLTSLKGRCGQGTIGGSGRGSIAGYGTDELQAHVALNAIPFENATLSTRVTGYLDFRKLANDMTLSGDLRLRDGFILADLRADDFKISSQSTYASTPLRLDIRVKTVDPIRVDTDMLSGELDAALQVVGTHLSPGLVGMAEIKAGQAQFRNKAYQLQKARVDFDDAYRIVPRLDVLATGAIDNYAIQLRLQGTPDKPNLHLTSDPFLPESQILVLMSLGYAAQDIKGLAATARNTGLEALSLYLGLGTNVMRFLNRKESSDFLRLEELSLTSVFSKAEGVSVPAVKLGMNAWSGVKLKLQSTLLESNGKREQRIELEQSLGRQLKWRLGWDSDGLSTYGDAGFDLWYRWELE